MWTICAVTTCLFTDIDTWLSHDGYVDYIMPQIYWGFEHQLSNGSPAPFAFENNLKTWISLVKKGHAKLYIGLAMYKAGSNARDNTGIPEWKRYDDVISRQVEAGRASGAVSGYCFYEYGSFQEDVSEGSKEPDEGIPVAVPECMRNAQTIINKAFPNARIKENRDEKLEDYVVSIPDFRSRESFSAMLPPFCRMRTDWHWPLTASVRW